MLNAIKKDQVTALHLPKECKKFLRANCVKKCKVNKISAQIHPCLKR